MNESMNTFVQTTKTTKSLPPKPSQSQIMLSRSRSRFPSSSRVGPHVQIEQFHSERKIERDMLSFSKSVAFYSKEYEEVLSVEDVEDVCRNIFGCFDSSIRFLGKFGDEFEPSKLLSSSSSSKKTRSIEREVLTLSEINNIESERLKKIEHVDHIEEETKHDENAITIDNNGDAISSITTTDHSESLENSPIHLQCLETSQDDEILHSNSTKKMKHKKKEREFKKQDMDKQVKPLEHSPGHLQHLTTSQGDEILHSNSTRKMKQKKKEQDLKKQDMDKEVIIDTLPLPLPSDITSSSADDILDPDLQPPLERKAMPKVITSKLDRRVKVSDAVSTLGKHALQSASKELKVPRSKIPRRSIKEQEYAPKSKDSEVHLEKSVDTLISESPVDNGTNENKPQADKNVPLTAEKITAFSIMRADSEKDISLISLPHVDDVLWEPVSLGKTRFPAVFPAQKLLMSLVKIRDLEIVEEKEDTGCVADDSLDLLEVCE